MKGPRGRGWTFNGALHVCVELETDGERTESKEGRTETPETRNYSRDLLDETNRVELAVLLQHNDIFYHYLI